MTKMIIDEQGPLLTNRNPDYGGVGALLIGMPGCGKTSAMGMIALGELMQGNLVVWRAKSTCQWAVFLKKKIPMVFWIEEGLDYKLYNRRLERYEKLEDYGEVLRWSDPKELIQNLKKGKVNVVQTVPINPKRKFQQKMFITEWIRILDAMTTRLYSTPITLFFDEVEDLIPMHGFYPEGTQVGLYQKELRKNNINTFYASQAMGELFWKPVAKIPWKIYMRGAKPSKQTIIKSKTMLPNLKPGEAIIEGGLFERMTFKFIGKIKEKELRAFVDLSDFLEAKISTLEKEALKEKKKGKRGDITSKTICMKCGYEWQSSCEAAVRCPACNSRVVEVDKHSLP